ncbi:MAG: TIGR03986 family CRISPR-associated RAMP protein [Cyanobacteria bacterium J06627_28]
MTFGYTAKLRRYDAKKKNEQKKTLPIDKGRSKVALNYSDGTLPDHGDHVWVKYNSKSYVVDGGIRRWKNPPKDRRDWYEGWVCITGANIESKRSERVFLSQEKDAFINIDNTIVQLWEELIRNYQQEHQKELLRRKENNQKPDHYLGSDPGETAWSRHVYIPEEIKLEKGTLCYVELDKGNNVIGVQPVTISRRLFDKAPIKLVDNSLKPPKQISELSPAERVFGWVNQKGKGGYKGNLRIHAVNCQSHDPIEPFGDEGLPLAILGQPKPSQFRFYASDGEGDPISSQLEKRDGYSQGQNIRGRKVYPHHNSLPADHWKDPTDGRERNYRQSNDAPKVRSNQNRSIKNWVKPGTIFTFNIDITNLSTVELGALLWLLTLPAEHFHRLGGGKPLGFGSVRLELDPAKTLDLRTGEQWKKFYSSLLPIETPPADIHESIAAFKTAVKTDYGPTFEETDFIKAFLTMAKGFEDGLPTHYPRTQSQPEPKGEGFKWFVANEQVGKGGRLNLPLLTEDKGLPYKAKQ